MNIGDVRTQENTRHPLQPLIMVGTVLRFKENKIISDMLERTTAQGFGLNQMSTGLYKQEDYNQLLQLIGYSFSGIYGLSDSDLDTAEQAQFIDEKDARIAVLEKQLQDLKDAIREPIAALFGKHPDDL